MTKNQRYKHEMFVRVRDFGAAHVELFPASSPGGARFADVSAVVATIEENMKNRVLGYAGTRSVKSTTRAAVYRYMQTLARAARQLARERRSQAPFILPRKRRLKVEVTTARAFLEEAARRQAEFVGMGLPETFISEFTARVDELDQAVNGRLSGKTMRGQARAGITQAIAHGMRLVGDLDVIVAIAANDNEVVAETWRIARRVEGQTMSAGTARPASDIVTPIDGGAATPPPGDAQPADAQPPAPPSSQPVLVGSDVLGRAS